MPFFRARFEGEGRRAAFGSRGCLIAFSISSLANFAIGSPFMVACIRDKALAMPMNDTKRADTMAEWRLYLSNICRERATIIIFGSRLAVSPFPKRVLQQQRPRTDADPHHAITIKSVGAVVVRVLVLFGRRRQAGTKEGRERSKVSPNGQI